MTNPRYQTRAEAEAARLPGQYIVGPVVGFYSCHPAPTQVANHTPGPWKVNGTYRQRGCSLQVEAELQCPVAYIQGPDGGESLANALLIAAAPEQNKALNRLADAAEALAGSDPEMPSHRETEAEFDAALIEARAALAKTEGR